MVCFMQLSFSFRASSANLNNLSLLSLNSTVATKQSFSIVSNCSRCPVQFDFTSSCSCRLLRRLVRYGIGGPFCCFG